MADTCEVPLKEGEIAGVNVDPYADPCQRVDIHSALIPFHNYRQIHISEIALYNGIEAPSIKELPPCPTMWCDVQHYWVVVEVFGYLFAEFFVRKGPLTDATGSINFKNIGINWWSLLIKVASAPVVLAVAKVGLSAIGLGSVV
jgi:hypothetical protein